MPKQIPSGRQLRTLTIVRSSIDEGSRTVEVAFSSEEPVERIWGTEVLGHGQGEVDLEWLASGNAPVLADHERLTQIGVIDSARIDRDKRGRAVIRFGVDQRSEAEFQNVKAGVRKNVSMAYEILDAVPLNSEASEAGYRITRWRPLEISIVSIPADMSVGVGRSHNSSKGTKQMPEQFEDGASQRLSRSQRRAAARDDYSSEEPRELPESDRRREIMYLATKHNLRQMGEEHIERGTTLEMFRGVVMNELGRRHHDLPPLYNPATEIGLSDGEAQRFSITRLLRSVVEGNANRASFEREACDQVKRNMESRGIETRGGFVLPFEIMRAPIPGASGFAQRDLSTSTVGAGGAMVATNVLATDFITLLRNRTLVTAMGARVLPGLVGNVSIPRQLSSVSVGWYAQAGAASESDATFAAVSMAPKTAHGIQDVTRDLLLQGTPAVEALIRSDLAATIATQVDYVALHGSGVSNQPTGLAATAGIGSVAGGTNGAAPTWDNIVDLESQVANTNAGEGAMGYLTNSRVRGKLRRTQKFTGTNGVEIWGAPPAGVPTGSFGSLNTYIAGVSNNVRSDLTKGTSTSICSGIFFGDWSDMLIGNWGTVEILPDVYTQAANRIIRFHVWQTIDIAIRRPGSFAAMLDALTV